MVPMPSPSAYAPCCKALKRGTNTNYDLQYFQESFQDLPVQALPEEMVFGMTQALLPRVDAAPLDRCVLQQYRCASVLANSLVLMPVEGRSSLPIVLSARARANMMHVQVSARLSTGLLRRQLRAKLHPGECLPCLIRAMMVVCNHGDQQWVQLGCPLLTLPSPVALHAKQHRLLDGSKQLHTSARALILAMRRQQHRRPSHAQASSSTGALPVAAADVEQPGLTWSTPVRFQRSNTHRMPLTCMRYTCRGMLGCE